MGLDMYLTRKIYVGGNFEHNNVKGVIDLETKEKKVPIDIKKITYIEEEAGYWRKANQIHKWFVDNVQDGEDDCKSYVVSIQDLEKLLVLCKKVKEKAVIINGYIKIGEKLVDGKWLPIVKEGEKIQNAEEIADILPTEDGFFFGSSEYDEYYLLDIEDTIKIIEEQIKREKELNEQGLYTFLEYSSSW